MQLPRGEPGHDAVQDRRGERRRKDPRRQTLERDGRGDAGVAVEHAAHVGDPVPQRPRIGVEVGEGVPRRIGRLGRVGADGEERPQSGDVLQHVPHVHAGILAHADGERG